MKFENQYVISGLKKSVLSNVKSFLLQIPFFTLIIVVLASIFMPIYNHSQFVQKGKHNYVYYQSESMETDESGSKEIFIPFSRNLTSHADPEQNRGSSRYYRYRKTVDILLCQIGTDVSHTMYSEENILTKVEDNERCHIWLSYELAKALDVGMGDNVFLTVSVAEERTPYELPLRVTGITATKYNDETPTKTGDVIGTGIAFFDKNTFQWLLEQTEIGFLNPVIFSDTAPEEDQSLYASKPMQLEYLKDYISANFFLFLYILVCGFVLTGVIVSFDVNFTLKRHNKNLIILNMLGTPVVSIRKMLLKIVMLNTTISLIIAFFLVKFVFLQGLLAIYAATLPLLLCFVIYWVFCAAISVAQMYKVKSV